ncbi:transposase [Pseudomonas savastanoi]|uniref:transposase n=1 Tax=Pseudomonas savastanoi TaxID=29438 RepID=UPI000E316699|nr:transposase [Pseudomonas savastanoi]
MIEKDHLPDETTILNFRHLLEKHELATGILGVINCSGLQSKTAVLAFSAFFGSD